MPPSGLFFTLKCSQFTGKQLIINFGSHFVRAQRALCLAVSYLSFLAASIKDPVIKKLEKILMLILLQRVRKRELDEKSRVCHYCTHPVTSQCLSSGYFTNMYVELRNNPDKFFNFTRMSLGLVDLLEQLRPLLTSRHPDKDELVIWGMSPGDTQVCPYVKVTVFTFFFLFV